MATEVDAADVLASYAALLMKTTGSPARDVNELKYSKDVIKFVLMHCIKLVEPGEQRDFLKSAYVSLADFQDMSDDELLNVVKDAQASGALAVGVYRRIADEAALLNEELAEAGV